MVSNMNWIDINNVLSKLDSKYLNLHGINNKVTYFTSIKIKNKRLSLLIKKILLLINNELNNLPKTMDDVRYEVLAYDLQGAYIYLNSISSGIDKIICLVKLLEELQKIDSVSISDKFEDTLYYKYYVNFFHRLYDIYDKDMTTEQKYDYANNFFSSLNEFDKKKLLIEKILYFTKDIYVERKVLNDTLDMLVNSDYVGSKERVLKYQKCVKELREYERNMIENFDVDQILNLYLPFFSDNEKDVIKIKKLNNS